MSQMTNGGGINRCILTSLVEDYWVLVLPAWSQPVPRNPSFSGVVGMRQTHRCEAIWAGTVGRHCVKSKYILQLQLISQLSPPQTAYTNIF